MVSLHFSLTIFEHLKLLLYQCLVKDEAYDKPESLQKESHQFENLLAL